LDKVEMTLKCPEIVTCGRVFRIRIGKEYIGKRIKVECPSCVGKFCTVVKDFSTIKTGPSDESQVTEEPTLLQSLLELPEDSILFENVGDLFEDLFDRLDWRQA
jgi:hypothetical protein